MEVGIGKGVQDLKVYAMALPFSYTVVVRYFLFKKCFVATRDLVGLSLFYAYIG